jgi:hypothetical protein
MKTRTIIAAIAAASAMTTPLLANAAANPPAFDSCVKAFVASLSNKVGAAPKLREARYISNAPFGEQPTELLMKARSPHNNRVVASALCTVSSRGEVALSAETAL